MSGVVDRRLVARFVFGTANAGEIVEMERRMRVDAVLAAEVAALRPVAARTRLLSRWEVCDGASGR